MSDNGGSLNPLTVRFASVLKPSMMTVETKCCSSSTENITFQILFCYPVVFPCEDASRGDAWFKKGAIRHGGNRTSRVSRLEFARYYLQLRDTRNYTRVGNGFTDGIEDNDAIQLDTFAHMGRSVTSSGSTSTRHARTSNSSFSIPMRGRKLRASTYSFV